MTDAQVAKKNVKVMVVGNPCNTNALIASSNAPSIPRENFHALTRLDENRAKAQLAGTLVNPDTQELFENGAEVGPNPDGSFNVDTILFEGTVQERN